MEGTQFGFLNACGASEQLIGRREIASDRGAFCLIEHAASILLFRHRNLPLPLLNPTLETI